MWETKSNKLFVILSAFAIFTSIYAVQAGALEVEKSLGEIHATLTLNETVDNRGDFELNAELCNETCKDVDIKSVSYSGGGRRLDIFLGPQKSGTYDLVVETEINGKSITHSRKVEIDENLIQQKKKPTTQSVTGSFATGEANPIFGLLLLSLLSVFFIFKLGEYLKRKDCSFWVVPVLLFLTSFFLLSTAIHELSHLILLEGQSCPYSLDMNFPLGPESIEIGECSIGKTRSAMTFLSGLGGNLLAFAAFFISFLSIERFRNLKYLSLSFGLLLSPITYLFHSSGDIYSVLGIFNLQVPNFYLNLAGISLLFGAFVAFGLTTRKLNLNSSRSN